MSSKSNFNVELGNKIIAKPNFVLDDHRVMQALTKANEISMGSNLIDILGIAMARLKNRLNQLEDTNRSVIAAAYDNLAGTSQIQRAILRAMKASDFPTLLKNLQAEVREILMVDFIALVLESPKKGVCHLKANLGHNNEIKIVPSEFVDTYLTEGRNIPVRDVVLRKVLKNPREICDPNMALIQSEAALKLCFKRGLLPGMLILGAEDPRKFSRQQGTDLLAFFSSFFERALRRWLACY